jgi:hypothetical protein
MPTVWSTGLPSASMNVVHWMRQNSKLVLGHEGRQIQALNSVLCHRLNEALIANSRELPQLNQP